MSFSHYARTKYDPSFEKNAADATRMIKLYQETFHELMHISTGCRALLAEMGHSDDANGTRAQLVHIVGKLDCAAAMLR